MYIDIPQEFTILYPHAWSLELWMIHARNVPELGAEQAGDNIDQCKVQQHHSDGHWQPKGSRCLCLFVKASAFPFAGMEIKKICETLETAGVATFKFPVKKTGGCLFSNCVVLRTARTAELHQPG